MQALWCGVCQETMVLSKQTWPATRIHTSGIQMNFTNVHVMVPVHPSIVPTATNSTRKRDCATQSFMSHLRSKSYSLKPNGLLLSNKTSPHVTAEHDTKAATFVAFAAASHLRGQSNAVSPLSKNGTITFCRGSHWFISDSTRTYVCRICSQLCENDE